MSNKVTVNEGNIRVVTVKSTGLRGPAGATGLTGAQGLAGSLTSSHHITASGNISSSGYVTAMHITASGNISASGYITVNSHITASGNISASGNIYGNIIYAHRFESSGSATSIDISDNLDVTGDITASGYILGKLVVPENSSIYGEDPTGNIPIIQNIVASNGTIFGNQNRVNTKVQGINTEIEGSGYILLDSDDVRVDGAITTVTNITASGDISASGTSAISGQDINASRDITAGRNLVTVGYMLNTGFTQFGNSADDTHTFTGAITASGNISASFTSTGSFGRLEVETIKATTGEFAANTIKLGTETFNQANITKLKAGKSLRDISTLSAKSYELGDGRKISREFEQRFNRWAPNLEFEAREGAEIVKYAEIDQIPQTYVDFTDKEYRIHMFGGRSHQLQTLYNIELKSDYHAGNSSFDIKSPKIRLSSQHSGKNTEVVISGSLTVTGSNTLTNYGNFTNYIKDRHRFKIEDTTYGNAPSSIFVVSGSGQAGVGTPAPKHTLHVSASSANFDALYVEGTTRFKGFAGANGFGNPNTLTGNTEIPAGYNTVLWVTSNSPSLTVPLNTNYTVGAGANIRMVNMDTAF